MRKLPKPLSAWDEGHAMGRCKHAAACWPQVECKGCCAGFCVMTAGRLLARQRA